MDSLLLAFDRRRDSGLHAPDRVRVWTHRRYVEMAYRLSDGGREIRLVVSLSAGEMDKLKTESGAKRIAERLSDLHLKRMEECVPRLMKYPEWDGTEEHWAVLQAVGKYRRNGGDPDKLTPADWDYFKSVHVARSSYDGWDLHWSLRDAELQYRRDGGDPGKLTPADMMLMDDLHRGLKRLAS